MFNKILPLLSFCTLLVLPACEKVEDLGARPFPANLDDGYTLVWSDEFEGDAIDASKWSFDIGDGCDRGICGWGNNELQYYTDDPKNAYVSNGRLVIKAIKETPPFMGNFQYTSARMVTKGKADWLYGRVDVRAKTPIGQGIWPAIWMLPTDTTYGKWPASGEIDIMELIGNKPNEVLGTIHFGHDNWRFISDFYELEEGTFNDEYHVFTVLWNEDQIQFLVDDIPFSGPYNRSSVLPTTWPFDHPFHMILNIAVGGNLPGNPDPTTSFPQVMEIDYVRVYKEK